MEAGWNQRLGEEGARFGYCQAEAGAQAPAVAGATVAVALLAAAGSLPGWSQGVEEGIRSLEGEVGYHQCREGAAESYRQCREGAAESCRQCWVAVESYRQCWVAVESYHQCWVAADCLLPFLQVCRGERTAALMDCSMLTGGTRGSQAAAGAGLCTPGGGGGVTPRLVDGGGGLLPSDPGGGGGGVLLPPAPSRGSKLVVLKASCRGGAQRALKHRSQRGRRQEATK